jgi:hypothetical protein
VTIPCPTFIRAFSESQTLSLPEPCDFLRQGLSHCSLIRPSLTENAGGVAAVRALPMAIGGIS